MLLADFHVSQVPEMHDPPMDAPPVHVGHGAGERAPPPTNGAGLSKMILSRDDIADDSQAAAGAGPTSPQIPPRPVVASTWAWV